MKHLFLPVLLLFLLISCENKPTTTDRSERPTTSTEDAERSWQDRTYRIPQRMPIDKDLAYGMCPSIPCLVEEFYPIGWSEDGTHFAWISEPESEATGGYNFTITIQNMVNDNIVWSWYFKEHELENWDETQIYDLVRIWNENNKTIQRQLNQYRIVQPNEPFTLQPFPANLNGRTYSANLQQQTRPNEYIGYEEIGQEQVFVNAEGLGRKRIANMTHKSVGFLHTKLLGLIPSLDQKRAAVVKINEKRGWEGPPHVLSVQLIGCDLLKGFE